MFQRLLARPSICAIAALASLAVVAITVTPATTLAQSTPQPPPTGLVSFRQPDGLIVSTGNLYFTSHDSSTAAVWRAAQDAISGQEILLYSEPGARFGDIVFAFVDGDWWGYFFAQNAGTIAIKRVRLTGGAVAVVATVDDVDVANSHRNLATDGTNLYWQDATAVRKMPIHGGASIVLDPTTPSTPTAGIELLNGNVIYASVAAIRFVPTSGAITSPLVRTIVTAASRVTALHAVSGGIFWGEQSGAVRSHIGSATTTLSSAGLVPTSVWSNATPLASPDVWTECGAQACNLQVRTVFGTWSTPIGTDALGATVAASGKLFWGDAAGVHRQ